MNILHMVQPLYYELKNYQIQLLNLKEEVLEDNPELEKDLQEVTNNLKQY